MGNSDYQILISSGDLASDDLVAEIYNKNGDFFISIYKDKGTFFVDTGLLSGDGKSSSQNRLTLQSFLSAVNDSFEELKETIKIGIVT